MSTGKAVKNILSKQEIQNVDVAVDKLRKEDEGANV